MRESLYHSYMCVIAIHMKVDMCLILCHLQLVVITTTITTTMGGGGGGGGGGGMAYAHFEIFNSHNDKALILI